MGISNSEKQVSTTPRRFRVSLRTLFVVVTVAAIVIGLTFRFFNNEQLNAPVRVPFVFAIMALGVGGVFVKHWVGRILIWLPSLALLVLGLLVLDMGGLAHPMRTDSLMDFCVVMFWPFVGCVAGELLRRWGEKIPHRGEGEE